MIFLAIFTEQFLPFQKFPIPPSYQLLLHFGIPPHFIEIFISPPPLCPFLGNPIPLNKAVGDYVL